MRIPLLASFSLLLGSAIIIGKVFTDGLTPSFVLVLGTLLMADGLLRTALAREE